MSKTVPFNTVHIDVIGPYNLPERGEDKYVLTILDPVSRQLEIVLLKTKDLEEISAAFDTQQLCQYPRPNCCVHNQEREFISQEFQELLQSYRITDVSTTVKNSQGNAMVEQVHQTIGNAIKTISQKFENDQGRSL